MEEIFDAQSKLVPEMVELMKERYRLLKLVKTAGPVGRRTLGELSKMTEREIRTMLDQLREQNLINVSKMGASITNEGIKVLHALETTIDNLSKLSLLAKKLEELLGIQSVKVVGDTTENSSLGIEAAKQFMDEIGDGKTVAVTGGTSIALIPKYIKSSMIQNDLLFIAARGGVGEDIGLQANVIAASFAEACGSSYKAFYYPEALSEEAHKVFRKDPAILKMINLYDNTDCVLHGIGDAQTMAKLRSSSIEEQHLLLEKGAKGESFGYYFDRSGKKVHHIRTVGIQTEQLQKVPLIIAVAGGEQKAEAILSYMASAPKQTILVTDESAANEMIRLLAE
ncbi:sugar-binding transcriptional regulator [Sporosarcina sp. FA9]|uniref:sugar-binding transcriptional regulator n=1 Tax=Sporosarcina sp. FA9 TaxID=3413030 RepID=UPI003F658AB3